jgi:hypothetical protein
VDVEHTAGGVVVLLGQRDPVRDGDAADHQHAVDVLDLADRFGLVAFRIDLDSTRLQRARVRARQSAAGGRHDVVERRRARWDGARGDAVVLGDLVVDAERDRLFLGREVGQALGSTLAGDANTRDIGGIGHAVRNTPERVRFNGRSPV